MKVMWIMRGRLLLPAMLVLVVMFAACAPPPELRDDSLLNDSSLVDGDPCGAPCWQGITPGVTSWNEALTILEDNSRLTNFQVEELEAEGGGTILRATWEQRRGPTCCQMFSEDGQTVSILFLQVAPRMRLGEVIQTHGEPAYAIGSEFSDEQAVMNLIYPDKQMVVYAFVEGPEGALSETSEIVAVLYMNAAEMVRLVSSNNLHAWQGYAPYSTYAPDSTEFSLTPLPAEEVEALVEQARQEAESEATAAPAEGTEAAAPAEELSPEATAEATAASG